MPEKKLLDGWWDFGGLVTHLRFLHGGHTPCGIGQTFRWQPASTSKRRCLRCLRAEKRRREAIR